MQTFQIIHQNGRVQNILADTYSRTKSTIRFRRDGFETQCFDASELIMIDELEDADDIKVPAYA
jgi:hypothetical protein